MKDVLDPLSLIPGVRLAALISEDGVPISLVTSSGPEDGEQQDETLADFQAFAAIAAGWRSDVQRAVGPLSWSAPERLVLAGNRGALVMCAAPGATLLVVLEHGASPQDLVVPMDGVVARMQRKLRNMGSSREQYTSPAPVAEPGTELGEPRSPLPAEGQMEAPSHSETQQRPSPQQ